MSTQVEEDPLRIRGSTNLHRVKLILRSEIFSTFSHSTLSHPRIISPSRLTVVSSMPPPTEFEAARSSTAKLGSSSNFLIHFHNFTTHQSPTSMIVVIPPNPILLPLPPLWLPSSHPNPLWSSHPHPLLLRLPSPAPFPFGFMAAQLNL